MRTFIVVALALRVMAAIFTAIGLSIGKFPCKIEKTAAVQVFELLLHIGFALWAALLLFGGVS